MLSEIATAARVLVSRGKITADKGSVAQIGSHLEVRGNGRIEIGAGCIIYRGAVLSSRGGFLRLGDRCSVHQFCVLYGSAGGLRIGNDVRIATHVVMVPYNHNFESRETPISKQGITGTGIVVEDDVWIGAHATVLDGTTISRGCVIAAGSVVRGKTEPYGVYAGVPAKLIRMRGD